MTVASLGNGADGGRRTADALKKYLFDSAMGADGSVTKYSRSGWTVAGYKMCTVGATVSDIREQPAKTGVRARLARIQ